jgi:hypothetical protein
MTVVIIRVPKIEKEEVKVVVQPAKKYQKKIKMEIMSKDNLIIGVVCLISGIVFMLWGIGITLDSIVQFFVNEIVNSRWDYNDNRNDFISVVYILFRQERTE